MCRTRRQRDQRRSPRASCRSSQADGGVLRVSTRTPTTLSWPELSEAHGPTSHRSDTLGSDMRSMWASGPASLPSDLLDRPDVSGAGVEARPANGKVRRAATVSEVEVAKLEEWEPPGTNSSTRRIPGRPGHRDSTRSTGTRKGARVPLAAWPRRSSGTCSSPDRGSRRRSHPSTVGCRRFPSPPGRHPVAMAGELGLIHQGNRRDPRDMRVQLAIAAAITTMTHTPRISITSARSRPSASSTERT